MKNQFNMNVKSFQKLPNTDFKMMEASESHITVELIDQSCIVYLEGAPPIIYLQEKNDSLTIIPELVNKISLNASTRSANKGKESILFGAVNRLNSKWGYCTHGSLISKDPELDRLLTSTFALAFDSIMKQFLSKWHEEGYLKLAGESIHPEYRMGDTNYTSGIINRNSPFKYHYDKFNLANTYSSMVVFKKGVSGGYLVLPEYGIGFKLDDQAIIQFYGKEILHGVTPIYYEKSPEENYRISVVYYVSQKLGECEPYEIELKKAQQKK